MREKDKKNQTMIFRCTESEKELINKKAKEKGKTPSQYVLDCAMAGAERKKDIDKKKLHVMMENLEKRNSFVKYLKSEECDLEKVREMYQELEEGENRLWEY